MAKKRQIDFSGPSIKDLGIKIEEQNGNSNIGNTENGSSDSGKSKIRPANNGIKPKKHKSGTAKFGSTKNTNANIGTTEKMPSGKRTYKTVQFTMIRDYLYKALGTADSVEIKLSEMCQELGINPKTMYGHLKTLRDTEFTLTKLQYGTEVRRK